MASRGDLEENWQNNIKSIEILKQRHKRGSDGTNTKYQSAEGCKIPPGKYNVLLFKSCVLRLLLIAIRHS